MKDYGKNTYKWFQARLRQDEFDDIQELIESLDITRRNFILRYLGIAKKIMTQEPKKRKEKKTLYKGKRIC